jgi:hypothetical protein
MRWWAYLIAIVEVLGGFAGIGVWLGSADEILVYMPDHPVTGVFTWLLAVLLLLLFVASTVAGVLLLARRSRGWQLSRIVQGVQLIQFHLLGVKFAFVSGPSVVAGVDRHLIINLSWNLGSSFEVWLGREPGVAFIGLNGIAAILFAVLLSTPAIEGKSNEIRRPAG